MPKEKLTPSPPEHPSRRSGASPFSSCTFPWLAENGLPGSYSFGTTTGMKALALFVATLLFCARAQSAVLDGQVFIATKGGENFKLALVSVQVFPLDQMKAYVARKKAANKDREPKIKARYDFLNRATHLAAKQSTDTQKAAAAGDSASLDNTAQEARRLYHELQDEQRWWTDIYCYLHSSLYYFEDLPVPMAVGKTDADGKFSIDAPQPGPWVVAATATPVTTSRSTTGWWSSTRTRRARPA